MIELPSINYLVYRVQSALAKIEPTKKYNAGLNALSRLLGLSDMQNKNNQVNLKYIKDVEQKNNNKYLMEKRNFSLRRRF